MREIKFRAWDKLVGEMVDVVTMDFETKNINDDDFYNATPLLNGEYELLQYTGLKDKNGVEIYEGDVLEIEPEIKEHYPEKSVFYVREYRSLWGYRFTWEHISGYDCSTHIAEIDDEYKQLLNVEVIGNIYEDGHLLEANND